jgi:UPF0042 nucleotide-binding protein
MEVLIVTGMSGAGKSLATSILEDIGFFCVDNLPKQMVKKLVEVANGSVSRIAIVIDVRGMKISGVFEELNSIPNIEGTVRLLFLDASDDVLVKRFQEQRRIHPLIKGEIATTQQAIREERKFLSSFRQQADYVIDTSLLSPTQLKDHIRKLFLEDIEQGVVVNCVSFGYKNGLPSDADLVFDVRCLPNPFYVPELRNLTGLNQEVQDYVMNFQDSQDLMKKLEELVSLLLPLYQKEGKSQVTIAFGCTGGQHRSVTFAERMHKFITELGYFGVASHRDAGKEHR